MKTDKSKLRLVAATLFLPVLAACAQTASDPAPATPQQRPQADPELQMMYGAVEDQGETIPAVPGQYLSERNKRQQVDYWTGEKPGTIVMATEGRLTDELIRDTLADAGLKVAALEEAYKRSRAKWDALMARNSYQAAQLGLQGTPAFIIGTTIYPGSLDADALRKAVELGRA